MAFSEFLEKAPDHPLAGSAQFYVGESYFKQKEYKLALQEYQRVLTSYDRSPVVADTLARMITTEEILKKQPEAEKHQHLLTSLFPNSPAARSLNPSHEPEKPEIKGPVEPHHSNSLAEPLKVEPLKEIPPTADSLPPQ